MKDNKYEELIFKDWIQLQEWNDPDWIVLSRYTSGIFYHDTFLRLQRCTIKIQSSINYY